MTFLKWELSSAGSEHLPYKQRVTGSNPVAPTDNHRLLDGFFMPVFYIYILYSERLNKFYVGSTNDLTRRLDDHNRGKTSFTKTGMPWALRYAESFGTRQEAVKRELEIKRNKSRKYIEKLISEPVQSIPADRPGGSQVRIL
jgi:putative endonuclease